MERRAGQGPAQRSHRARARRRAAIDHQEWPQGRCGVSADDWEKASKPKQTFYDFLRASPLVGVELDLERDKSGPRDIEL